MPEEIAILFAFILMGTFTLTGLRMFLNYRVKRFAQSGSAEDTRRLEDAVASLRDEVYLLRSDLTDLGERVDFAERLLAQSRQAEPPELPRR